MYRLGSFDGTSALVQLSDKAFAETFVVCLKDTLFLPDYWAPGEVKVLGGQFLQVSYRVRGGSNVGAGNTL